SSPYAMRGLITLKDTFDIAFACDPDHDRHGIVTRSAGLLPSNHYLAVAIHHLFADRREWREDVAVGKTMVSSSMIDRVTARLGRRLYDVPVGFKWFGDGLLEGRLGFAGEVGAGRSFRHRGGLQAVRRELPRHGPPATGPARGGDPGDPDAGPGAFMTELVHGNRRAVEFVVPAGSSYEETGFFAPQHPQDRRAPGAA